MISRLGWAIGNGAPRRARRSVVRPLEISSLRFSHSLTHATHSISGRSACGAVVAGRGEVAGVERSVGRCVGGVREVRVGRSGVCREEEAA